MSHNFIFTADWQLRRAGRSPWYKKPELAEDQWIALEYLFFQAEQHHAAIVVAGDVFDDGNPGSQTLERLRDLAIQKRPRPIGYILGQHDEKQRWLSLLDATDLDCDPTLAIDFFGERFYGFDYQYADEVPGYIANMPKNVRWVVCHQVWHEFMGSRGSCDLSDFPEGDYGILTGDYHQHALSYLHGNKVPVMSPGGLSANSIDEPWQKSAFLILDGKISSFPLPSRPILRHTIQNDDDLKNLQRSIDGCMGPLRTENLGYDGRLAKPIVEVEIVGEDKSLLERIQNSWDAAHFIIRYSPKPTVEMPESKSVDPVERFSDFAETEDEARLARELYGAKDKAAWLLAHEQKARAC